MDRNNEKPSCGQRARNAAKPAQKGPPASIETEEDTHNLNLYAGITLEAILEPSNLKEALKRVVANRGAPGIDGMEVGQLLDWIRNHPGQLTKAIKEGTYRPSPVKRVSTPKDEPGKFRDLGIPTVIDRLVQQATAQVLDWAYDRDFSDRSFGFRRNMRAHHALRVTAAEADQGYRWAVDMDLAKFFDTVNHSRLIRKLSLKIKDGRVISLIHKMLRSGVQINGETKPTEIGLMQGGPLSPLLANIYLDELDKELEKRGHRFARYADDLICICKSRRAAERTLASLTRFVQDKMLLKVNQEKSHVSLVTSSRTKFLGYGFYFSRAKGEVRLTIHKKSKQEHDQTTTYPEPKNEHRECETAASAEASGVDELLPTSRCPKVDTRGRPMDTAPYPPALVENLEKSEDEDKSPYKTRGGSCQSLLLGLYPKGLLANIQQSHSRDHSDHRLPQTKRLVMARVL